MKKIGRLILLLPFVLFFCVSMISAATQCEEKKEVREIEKTDPAPPVEFTSEIHKRMVDEAKFWMEYSEAPISAMDAIPASIFKRADLNNSGRISGRREIKAIRAEYRRWQVDMLKHFDKDKNGKISKDEVKAAKKGLADHEKHEKEVNKIKARVVAIDTSGDGVLDDIEIEAWMKKLGKVQQAKDKLVYEIRVLDFWNAEPVKPSKEDAAKWQKQVEKFYDKNKDGRLTGSEKTGSDKDRAHAQKLISARGGNPRLAADELSAAIDDMKTKARLKLTGIIDKLRPLIQKNDSDSNSLISPEEFVTFSSQVEKKLSEIISKDDCWAFKR